MKPSISIDLPGWCTLRRDNNDAASDDKVSGDGDTQSAMDEVLCKGLSLLPLCVSKLQQFRMSGYEAWNVISRVVCMI